MKKLVKLLFTLSITLFTANTLAATPPSNTPHEDAGPVTPINRIVAVVNTDIVTQQDLDNALKTAKRQLQQRGITNIDAASLKANVLNQLILTKLQLQIAKQNNITVTDTMLNEAIKQIASQNNVTVAQLKKQIAKENLSFNAFRKQIREQLVIRSLQQQAVVSSIKLTKADVEAYKQKLEKTNRKNSYHVIDYLISLPAYPTAAQKQKALASAKALVKTLTQGKTPSKNKNIEANDMGYRDLSDLPDLFATPLKNLQTGGVSTPILAGNGYHVLKLEAIKKEEKPISMQQAQQALFQEKFQKALQKWLDQLRKQAYIKIYN